MLNNSAGQNVPRFIVWDNIMLKFNEIKNDIENFWSIYVLKSVSFHFFTLSGAPKPSKKLGDIVMRKNLVTKNW